MKLSARSFSLSVVTLAAGVTLFLSPACSDAQDAAAATAPKSAVDQPLSRYRKDLLDLADRAASKFPLDPHIKNRSRAQQAVVTACLELDQPRLAQRYIEGIDNWRRGAGYADLACYCVEHHATADVPHFLELAAHVADEVANDPVQQEWRRDNVRAKIAKAYLLLGDVGEARRFGGGVEPSQAAEFGVAEASLMPADAFERQKETYDRVIETGTFDDVQNVLHVCATLFDRFYDDADRRDEMEKRVRDGSAKLPCQLRIELLTDLIETALRHQDSNEAMDLVDAAQALLGEAKWLPEDEVPMRAHLAGLRWRAGDENRARADLTAAETMFADARERIVDIYRAAPLRAIAEAYAAIGDLPAARAAYARAVEEGVANPNSRPRAQDLVATAISMAVHEVTPDAALWQRMVQVCDGLGDPW